MNQTDESAQGGQKPKICKLAVASPLVVILGFLTGLVLVTFLIHEPFLDVLVIVIFLFPMYLGWGALIFLITLVIGLFLGIIATWKIHRSKGALKGYVFSTSGPVLVVIMIALVILPKIFCTVVPASRVVCGTQLSGLGRTILLYNHDYDGYPTPNIWCDLLVKYEDIPESCFACPDALKRGDKGPCHYAFNPNCSPNSPNDVVLLFETKGGWNQFGGAELLTTEHHKKGDGEGCNILFNDGHVDFITTEHLGELKWGGEPVSEPNQ